MNAKYDAILGELRESDSAGEIEEVAAAKVTIADAGEYFESTTVEAALQEVGSSLDGVVELLMEI